MKPAIFSVFLVILAICIPACAHGLALTNLSLGNSLMIGSNKPTDSRFTAEWSLWNLPVNATSVPDMSGHGNTLSLGNGLVNTIDGVYFNGSSSATAPSINLSSGALTVIVVGEFQTPIAGHNPALVNQYTASSGYNLLISPSSTFQFHSQGGTPAGISSNSAISTTTFSCVAASYDGLHMTEYYDGLIDSNNGLRSGSLVTNSSLTYVGISSSTHQYLTGTIAYMGIATSLFSDADIYNTCQWAVANTPTGLPQYATYPGDYPTYLPTPITLPWNGIGKLPIMAWNGFASLGGANNTEANIESAASTIAADGLQTAGYNLISVDDGWMSPSSTGELVPDPTKFPDGMAALGSWLHSNGFLFGIYSSPGPITCAAYPASFGHETEDAAEFASWGVDYLKYDLCSLATGYTNPQTQRVRYAYTVMGQALRAAGRPIIYDIWAYGNFLSTEWGAAAGGNIAMFVPDLDQPNQWPDIEAAVFNATSGVGWVQSHPGYYITPDMLKVGATDMTDGEGRAQISIYSLLASPLIFDAKPATLSTTSLATLGNTDVIAVDQDSLGVTGAQISSVSCGSGTCQVWAKPLNATDTCAIGFFNLDSASHDISTTWNAVASIFPQCGTGPYATTRDLWTHSSLGTLIAGYTAAAVAGDDVDMIKVAP